MAESRSESEARTQAEAALKRYWAAWDSGDYSAFHATTTSRMRASTGIASADEFATVVGDLADTAGETERAVITVAVATRASDNGAPSDGDRETDGDIQFDILSEESSRDGSEYLTEHVRHLLLRSDGAWRVHDEVVVD